LLLAIRTIKKATMTAPNKLVLLSVDEASAAMGKLLRSA
jgi:hypothetical protein